VNESKKICARHLCMKYVKFFKETLVFNKLRSLLILFPWAQKIEQFNNISYQSDLYV